MVGSSHPSGGSSLGSLSVDADIGVSSPSSPPSTHGVVMDLVSCPLKSGKEMGAIVSSEGSNDHGLSASAFDPSEIRREVQQIHHKDKMAVISHQDSLIQDVFKAAHHFSQQDRIDVVAEHKKNLDLMNFISAHGLSVTDVNDFLRDGSIARPANAHNVLDNIPHSKAGDVAEHNTVDGTSYSRL